MQTVVGGLGVFGGSVGYFALDTPPDIFPKTFPRDNYNNVNVLLFDVLEPDINSSDHLPIFMVCTADISRNDSDRPVRCKRSEFCVEQLRWDHADLTLYYYKTQAGLQPILTKLTAAENDPLANRPIHDSEFIGELYGHIVQVLQQCASISVPKRRKDFFKTP